MAGKLWAFVGAFRKSGVNLLAETLPPETGYKSTYLYDGSDFNWRFPSQQMVSEFRIKSDASYRRESYAEWQYPNGTVMLSLLDFSAAAGDASVSTFVREYCMFTLDNLPLFRKQYEQFHAFRGMNHKLIRRGMLDDTGAPALPFVELFRVTHEPRLQSITADIAQYVSKGQVRLEDGTLCRYEKMPGTVWADDLFMAAPYLVRMGAVTGDDRYFDDAAKQVVMFNKYLLDQQTGLYRHGWYDLEKRQSAVACGRANGWVVWATSEVLRFLPSSHPLRDQIVSIYRRHLEAIVACQAPSGLWHQVLDRPESYEETSCTAMYLIGMARGIRSGILDTSFVRPMLRAWSGLQARISAGGIVRDICRGTEMSDDPDYYFKRERFDNDPRGLGAVITACVEMMHFEKTAEKK
jgi:rhamnogalacturonyl hydrolase YesR